MGNGQLEYYLEHNISPEHQNISDLDVHYARRGKLYRQCGIPEIAFRDARILEVGPGGGYNTLAFFHWNCKHVDLVEANPNGVKDMRVLFAEQNIAIHRYDIYECVIEEYSSDKKYDIIIAEGFIPNIPNQEEVLEKLKSLISDNGIIVITCGDRVNFLIEIVKRMVGRILTQRIPTYEEKVRYLTGIFEPQLAKLRGVSKLPEDWVRDNIFNPEINNEYELSLAKAIQMFEKDFDVLGSSPQMFTDYSWSKDIWYDYKKDYMDQFEHKRLSLLKANMPEIILPVQSVNLLLEYFESIISAETEYEKTMDIKYVRDMIGSLDSAKPLVKQYFPDEFINVFNEICDILLCVCKGEEVNMEKYPDFFQAFGRTQQYISFVKK